MSGPKLMELRRLRRAAIRKHNLERMAELKARYARLLEHVRQLKSKLGALGMPITQQFESLDQLTRKYTPLLDSQHDVEVVREFESRTQSLQEFTADLNLKFQEKLAEIENRRLQLERDRQALEDIHAEIKQRLEFAGVKEKLPLPEIPGLPGWKSASPDIASLELAENAIVAARQALEIQREKIATPAQSILPNRSAKKSRTVAELLRKPASVENPAAKIESAKREWERAEEINALVDSAAAFSSPAVLEIVQQLKNHSSIRDDIGVWKQKLAAAVGREQAEAEREDKRRALLESLHELGYETNEHLETALVKAGRLVFSSPHKSEYGLEIVANQDLSQVQSALVRFSADGDLSEEQRRRDIEHEGRWCQDHAKLRQSLAARGFDVSLKAQLRPGQHPVKILVDPNLKRSKTVRASSKGK